MLAGAAVAEHTVSLTALVHDAEGRASSRLSASDFVLTERGRQRSLSRFRNLRPIRELISQRPPDQYLISNRPLAALGKRQPVNILVLDTRNTDPEFQPWMRNQALRFISMLQPGEDIAFYQLSASGLVLLHQFSSGKPQLSDVLARVSEPETAREFERESSSAALRAQRYSATCDAISSLAGYLGEFPDRKNLVWVAVDFPPLVEPGKNRVESVSTQCVEMTKALNGANAAVYPVEVRSPIPPEPFLRYAPGNLFAVPRRRREALSSDWLGTMATLAALTGGRPLGNRYQLAEAIIDALRATRFAYELGFAIEDSECDDKFHPLRVETKIHDAKVLAKQAFVSDCGASLTRESPKSFDSPAIGISVMPRPRIADVLINSRDLQWSSGQEPAQASVKITIEAIAATGKLRLLTSRVFSLTTASGQRGPAQVEISFEPNRDASNLRIEVRDETNGRQGSVTFRNTR